jgi:hypothetical protein
MWLIHQWSRAAEVLGGVTTDHWNRSVSHSKGVERLRFEMLSSFGVER